MKSWLRGAVMMAAATICLGRTLCAQELKPQQGDYIAKNFTFKDGEKTGRA